MIVLGFDTATHATAVGLRLLDGSALQARDDPLPGGHPGHATRLLALAAGLLGEAGVRWREVERIAVGVGPGTFTGLRVGVATARGLAQSLGAELVGVSSLAALAHGALAEPAGSRDRPDGVLAVIDARRGEAFAAAFLAGADAPEEIEAPRVLGPDRLAALAAELDERRRWLAIGDGAVRYRERLQAAVEVPEDGSSLHLIGGAAVCELGARAAAAGRPEDVRPEYLRRPDAEIALKAAGAGAASKP
jgi:tRNA threonylcarbamoyladenosine biosynthesis protein TsaB